MRWMLSAVLAVSVSSAALADHLSFGFGFGRTRLGGGNRCYGPSGYGHDHFGYRSRGLSIFGAARINLYNSLYGGYGYSGPMLYYHGPAYPSYYDGYYEQAPPPYGYSPPVLYGPTVPGFQPDNPVLFDPQHVGRAQPRAGGQPLAEDDLADALGEGWEEDEIIEPAPRVSNAESKRRSLRLQAFGDEWLARRDFPQALQRYKDAATMAPDRAEPRLRMGIAYCAMGRPALAAREIKRSLNVDPAWPITSDRLDTIFGGPSGDLARNAMMLRLGDWVREDIRDPERLLVLGTMLYLNGDGDQALPFLKASSQLSGTVAYLDPFLKKSPRILQAGAEQPAPADVPGEPRPRTQIVKPRTVQPRSVRPAPTPAVEPDLRELPALKAPDAE